jgi:M6 family metalloprotease-like protein
MAKTRPARKLPFTPTSRPKIAVGLPKGPLFVGSFHRVPVKLGTGVSFDDLEFIVPDGPKGGLVSPSRDRAFDPKRPHFMLLVGYEPGTWRLDVRHRPSNTVIWSGKFDVDALWRDTKSGPPIWFTGTPGGYAAGAAWGGGGAGPQNVNVVPASGTRRIAVLLVDTSDQRYSTDAPTVQGFRDRWMDELIDGVVDGGVTRSVRQYFREVSYNTFDISAQVFGPVQLPGDWDDYFVLDAGGNWAPAAGYWQACVTAGDGLIDYTQFDTLACISQQVDGPPVQRAWPYANGGTFTTAEGNRTLGVISMPNEWGVAGNREIFDTFSHELGHNLGLGDQYTPAVTGRNLGSWEMMDWDDPMPHFTIAHRLMLGWVQAGWVQSFDFSALGGTVDQTVTLHPIEQGAPAAGRRTGVEIRIADGWNYYFEYRRGQGGQIGDRALPEDGVVLGSDVVSPPWTPPFSRPGLLLLPPDTDNEGAALSNGENYRETDYSDPTYPTDFRVDVSGIDANKADLRIRYGVLAKPDPSIRPWPAGPDRQWQSPDIEVRNTRNQADSAWFNVPWIGNPNTIVAKVKNNGTMNAPQVRVNFYVKNFNVGGAPESFLGTDVRDVAAGATVEFSTGWVPPSGGHYCVVVRIPLYSTPATPPAVPTVEMTELNNIAQSNYDRFISATSVPSREVTTVDVGNPYPIATRVFLHPGQTNPAYRTYLESTSLWLEPGETKRVTMMFELAPDNLGNKVYPNEQLPLVRKMLREPNRVGVVARIEDPNDSPRHKIDVLGGAEAQIVTGKSTRFDRFDAVRGAVRGRVVTVEGRHPVPGKAIVRTTRKGEGQRDGDAAVCHYQTVKLTSGSFSAKLLEDAVRVDAYYLPAPGYADCWSEPRTIQVRRVASRRGTPKTRVAATKRVSRKR